METLQHILRNYNQLSDEAAAKRFKHKIAGKYTKNSKSPSKVDTRTYTDNDGNVYTVDLSRSSYSEAGGLSLAVVKQRQNVEQERENLLKIKDANDKMLERRKRQAQLAVDSFAEASGEQKVKLSQYHDALRKQIQRLENANNDIDTALKNLDVEQVQLINADSAEAQNIFYKDNDGKTTTLAEEYKKTKDVVTEEAKEAKDKRLNRTAANRYQYNEIIEITTKDAQRELGDLEEQNESSEIKRAIAYPIGDKNNAKATSILSSPYYQARFWHGFFYFEADPAIVDSWKSNDASQKRKAKEAIKKMDKLVQ